MSQTKLGVELCANTVRVASIAQNGATDASVEFSEFDAGVFAVSHLPASSEVRLVLDDHQSIVRLVRTAEVPPELAEMAARFEADSALLSDPREIRTMVTPLSTSDQPEIWLAYSAHTVAIEQLAGRLQLAVDSNKVEFCPRSIALGYGYLHLKTQTPNISAVVAAPLGASAAITFICRGDIVGVAQMRGLNPATKESAAITHWISDYLMLAQYRLTTDLRTFYSGIQPGWILAADDQFISRANSTSPIQFDPALAEWGNVKRIGVADSADPSWLIALGAACN